MLDERSPISNRFALEFDFENTPDFYLPEIVFGRSNRTREYDYKHSILEGEFMFSAEKEAKFFILQKKKLIMFDVSSQVLTSSRLYLMDSTMAVSTSAQAR